MDEGSSDTLSFASRRVNYLLSNYIKPELDPCKDEQLKEFVEKKKASQPDQLY